MRSESPLRISLGDSASVVEVEPANMLARALWGEVARGLAKSAHLEFPGVTHGRSLS